MIVLGITRDNHDPSAALVVDGATVAAAEEERFAGRKHAPDTPPVEAALFCLKQAGVGPGEVHAVAYPYSLSEYRKNRWPYFFSHAARLPGHALKAVLKTGPRWRRERAAAGAALHRIGIDREKVLFEPVPHHLSHAASAFYCSGFDRALTLTVDAMGEFDSAGAWVCGPEGMKKVFEVLLPHSIGTFYTAVTEFLGFEPNDGEYKTMGMAAYGAPEKAVLDFACRLVKGLPLTDPRRIFPPRKFRKKGQAYYSDDFEEFLGAPRRGDGLSEPFVHIAAAAQDLLERTVAGWLQGPLRSGLEACGGNLAMAGGVALNVRMNQKIAALPSVKSLWVQPASGDAGGSLGAALEVSRSLGDRPGALRDAFLGPEFSRAECEAALSSSGLVCREPAGLEEEVASLLAKGAVVGRFAGRMEWGPRALGNRSILAHPGIPGTAKRINEAVKFREAWRPFCPSVLAERAGEVFETAGESPYMTVGFQVGSGWGARIPEVVHVDGSSRIQTVDRERTPGFYRLLSAFEKLTGIPLLLNTSLNRRGEPLACTPADALRVFSGSALEHLALGPFLISKQLNTMGSYLKC